MVEIIMKIIKSEVLLRVTPPKIKKNKKLRERVGAVGGVGSRGGWGCEVEKEQQREQSHHTGVL